MDSIGEEPVESPSEGSFDTGADGSGDSAYADDGDELDDDGLEPFGAAPEDEPEAATDGDEPEGEPDGEDTTEGA